MKHHLTAVALAAFSTAAFSQASVSISGTIDLAARHVDDGKNRREYLVRDGANASKLVFSGIEDLGNGLKAGFNLDMQLRADTGAAASTFWERRANVSLYSPLGELRFGRDFALQNSIPGDYDAFNGKGVGNVMNLATPFNFSNTGTYTRVSNAVSYLTPATLGGFYGQVQVAAGEGEIGMKQTAFGIGFAKGKIDARLTYGQTDVNKVATVDPATGQSTDQSLSSVGKFKYAAFGAAYDFSVVKVLGSLLHWTSAPTESGDKRKQFNYNIGAMVPVGAGSFNVAYTHANRSDLGSDEQDASQFAVQYLYNLSKRTALYTSASHLKQDRLAAADTAKGGAPYNMDGVTVLGTRATGFDFGIRHKF